MEKQETKRVLDNLRMPKQKEFFTTVAIVCHPCIIATRDSQFCKTFLRLFCFEQVKALKNFSQKLYTKDKQEKKKQRQEVTFGTTEKMPKLAQILKQSRGMRQVGVCHFFFSRHAIKQKIPCCHGCVHQ